MQFFLKLRSKQKREKGFTLIELLIVIAILAILALLGLPRLAAFRADAQAREIISTAETIGRAAEAFIAALPADATLTDYETVATLEAAVDDYLDADTASRLGTDYDINYTASTGNIEVEYTGSQVVSNAIGTIDSGDTLYPTASL